MSFNTLDLNALRVLHTLLRVRSVSKAAQALHVTQPSVSYALSKLRHQFKDKLFVKSRSGMVPTQRALELAEPLAEALEKLESAISNRPDFDPASTEFEVRIAAGYYANRIIVPGLLGRFALAAPRAKLIVESIDCSRQQDSYAAQDGRIVLTTVPWTAPGFSVEALLSDHFVVVSRRGHPAMRQKLDVATYLSLPTLVSTSKAVAHGYLENYLADRGLSRNHRISVPPGTRMLLKDGLADFIYTTPHRFFQQNPDKDGLQIVRPPIDVPPVSLRMVWSDKSALQEHMRWALDLIRAETADILRAEQPVKLRSAR